MANTFYIRINGSDVSYVPGSVRVSRSTSAPMELDFTLKRLYSVALPAVGSSIQLFLKDDTLYFNGTLESLDGVRQMDQTSPVLEIPVKCLGKDSRMYNRFTYNEATGMCAQYRSYSGIVNTDGNSVTWVSGDKFSQDFFRIHLGRSIAINDVDYNISSIDSPDHITLTTSAGAQSSVGYEFRVWSGRAIKELLDVYCEGEGFTYDSSSIEDGVKLGDIAFDPPVMVAEGISQIVKYNEGYAFSCRPDAKCFFGPWTLRPAPKDFADDTDAYKRNIETSYTREDVRNVEISGLDSATVALVTKSITGDGATRSWFLDSRLGEFKAARLNGVPLERIGDAQSTGQDYYYRVRDSAFWQDAAVPALTVGDTLEIDYIPLDAYLQVYKDTTNINSRKAIEGSGSGRYEQYVERTNFLNAADAQLDATASVNRLKSNMVHCKLDTKDTGYDVGQVLNVKIADNSIDEQLFIDEITAADSASAGLGFLYYTLTLVSVSRRITSTDILRSLFNGSTGNPGSSGMASGGGGVTPGISNLTSSFTLSQPTTVLTPPSDPIDGQILIVFIRQDATGGREITWNSVFESSTPVDINTEADSVTIFTFVGSNGFWWNIGIKA